MGNAIAVRNIDPGDKNWLKSEAFNLGVFMEEFVRRLIRDCRAKHESRMMPSEVFARHFGPEKGMENLPLATYGYRPIEFAEEGSS